MRTLSVPFLIRFAPRVVKPVIYTLMFSSVKPIRSVPCCPYASNPHVLPTVALRPLYPRPVPALGSGP